MRAQHKLTFLVGMDMVVSVHPTGFVPLTWLHSVDERSSLKLYPHDFNDAYITTLTCSICSSWLY